MVPKKWDPKWGSPFIAFRLDKLTLVKLDAWAKNLKTNRSALIKRIITDWLKAYGG